MRAGRAGLILGVLGLISMGAVAQESASVSNGQPAPAPSVVSFIGDAVKNSASGAAINLKGEKFGAQYVSIRTLDWPAANSFDVVVGGVYGLGHPDALISARINIPQLINLICDTNLFVKHTHGMTLPTLFLGPAVKAEWPVGNWTWKRDTFLLLGIPLGSLSSAK